MTKYYNSIEATGGGEQESPKVVVIAGGHDSEIRRLAALSGMAVVALQDVHTVAGMMKEQDARLEQDIAELKGSMGRKQTFIPPFVGLGEVIPQKHKPKKDKSKTVRYSSYFKKKP